MRWLRRKVGKVLHVVLRIWFCTHDTLIQERIAGEMRLLCPRCWKHWPAGFERSPLAKRLDRQQRAAQKRRATREATKPALVSRRVA